MLWHKLLRVTEVCSSLLPSLTALSLAHRAHGSLDELGGVEKLPSCPACPFLVPEAAAQRKSGGDPTCVPTSAQHPRPGHITGRNLLDLLHLPGASEIPPNPATDPKVFLQATQFDLASDLQPNTLQKTVWGAESKA